MTEFLIYTAPGGDVKVEAILHDETVWLTIKRISELFGVDRSVISRHINKIFASGELDEKVTCAFFAQVTEHGVIIGKTRTQQVKFYNLSAIIAVGYRVNSIQATQFRVWATQIIKDYTIKGFALDDDRLKNGHLFSKDYVQELLERVRSIRASERHIYQKITDIFAECSIDYDPQSKTTRSFYANVQNKFHYAITGQTASEKIYTTADSSKPSMGLTTYKNAPHGRVLKSDTIVGKNYLSEGEIKKLERTISAFFDYIEGIIERRQRFTMEKFAESVIKFLEFNEYEILEGHGKISHKTAAQKAHDEYDKFNKTQKIDSDFDKIVKKIKKGGVA